MSDLFFVQFTPMIGQSGMTLVYETEEEALAVYERARAMLRDFVSRLDEMPWIPFDADDLYGRKTTLNLAACTVTFTSAEISAKLNRIHQAAIDDAKMKHGDEVKMGIR